MSNKEVVEWEKDIVLNSGSTCRTCGKEFSFNLSLPDWQRKKQIVCHICWKKWALDAYPKAFPSVFGREGEELFLKQ